jgi:hypothetical protein
MHVQLGDDAMHPMKGLGSISFEMPLGDILELDFVLFVLDITNSLLSVSCMTNLQCLVEFDGEQVTIRDRSHASGRVLDKGVQEGGL